MSQPYKNEEDRNICEDYLHGTLINELKEKYHHGHSFIKKILKNYDIPLRGQITEEQRQDICNKYKKGYSIKELSKQYHKSSETIETILKSNNIHYDQCAFSKQLRRMSDSERQDIIKEYQSGKSLAFLNRKYKLHRESLKKLLRENGIVPRNYTEAIQNSNRKYSVDYNFFSSNTPEMWYMVGFVAADGNIAKYSNSLDITLAQKDAYLLEDMKKYLNFTGSVKYFETSHGDEKCRLTITHKQIVADLEQYNIVRNKTFLFSVPEIPVQYQRDFLLGYFDGDGSINLQGTSFEICSVQKDVLEIFSGWLSQLGVQNHMRLQKRDKETYAPLYTLGAYHTKEIPLIYHYLYDNLGRSDLFLKRKKERFENNSYLK